MRFEFATATRIIFGAGTLQEVGSIAVEMGKRALVVNGLPEAGRLPIAEVLTARGLDFVTLPVNGEPTVDEIRRGTQYARENHCDLIIGFGGGSALDTGKAIAAFLTNTGDITDYLEVIGLGRSLTQPSVPYIAVPTTAGTGAEVTRNAVLGSPEHRMKVSIRSPYLLPRLSLIDPELTYSLSPSVTASTGLDALTQLIEPFVSIRANPFTDAICREGMTRAARSLRRVYENGSDAAAREDMALASLFGGISLANAGLGAVHGFASVLGGNFPAPHGAICACLLPFVMDINIRALQMRQPESTDLHRYDEVARILTGKQNAQAADGIAWAQELCSALDIPSLSSYGMTADDIPEIVGKSTKASSMKSNPIQLSQEEMTEILESAL